MGPSRGAREEVEEFDNYHEPSAYQPKPSRKRPAGSARSTPVAKRPAVAEERARTARKAKPVKRVKPAVIVISIDFSTTFTGLTYAYSGDAGKLQTMTDWVNGNGDDPKTPSAIKFGYEGIK
ncbi:hypothetical protein VSDG_00454 [Cytospora chrysosperma]|uniref:Uncharacterized protein n=1 Tax=Cytospora chrysosperma TaxID=252740 RepID=A0A423WPA1_CYTCH|nr:hypothetical protein VSDG_00454 [Valsa sordida]